MRDRLRREQEFSRRLRYKQHIATRYARLKSIVRRGRSRPLSLWQRHLISERDRLLAKPSLLKRIVLASCLRVVPCVIGISLVIMIGWVVGKQLGDMYALSPITSHFGILLFAGLVWCTTIFVERLVHLDASQRILSAAEIARKRMRSLGIASCFALAAIGSCALLGGIAYRNWSFSLFGISLATAGTFSCACWRATKTPQRPARAGEISSVAAIGFAGWAGTLVLLMLFLSNDSVVSVAIPQVASQLLQANSVSSWCIAATALVACSTPAIFYAGQIWCKHLHRRILQAIRYATRFDPSTRAETAKVVEGDEKARQTIRRAMDRRLPSPLFYLTELFRFRAWLLVVMTIWTGALVAFFSWIDHNSPIPDGQSSPLAVMHLILLTLIHEGPLAYDTICRFRTNHLTSTRLLIELQKCGVASLVWQLPLVAFCIAASSLATNADLQLATGLALDLTLCLAAFIAMRVLVFAATLVHPFFYPPATLVGDIIIHLAPVIITFGPLLAMSFLISRHHTIVGSVAVCCLVAASWIAAYLMHHSARRPML